VDSCERVQHAPEMSASTRPVGLSLVLSYSSHLTKGYSIPYNNDYLLGIPALQLTEQASYILMTQSSC